MGSALGFRENFRDAMSAQPYQPHNFRVRLPEAIETHNFLGTCPNLASRKRHGQIAWAKCLTETRGDRRPKQGL
jgi:hypothetical protein